MKKSRPLLLLGGAVASSACVFLACARRRTRQRRSSASPEVPTRRAPLRVVSLLFITRSLFGYGFDAGAIFGGIWNFLTGIGSDVRNFVLEAVQKAADYLVGLINTVDDVYHAVTGVLTEGLVWATQQAENAAGAVANVVQVTYDEMASAFSNFRDQVKAALEHGYDDVKNYVLDQIPALLESLLGDAWTFLKSLASLGVDGLDFLLQLATDPFGTIWDLIKQAVEDALGVALPPFEWIVQQGLDLLFAGFGDVVAVLKGAWHFLVWVADHAADLTEDALSAGFGLGGAVFDDSVLATLTARSDELEKIVADWFA